MHTIIKSSQIDSRRLAELHLHQAVHQRNLENGYRLASPGGTRIHRQAVSPGNLEIRKNGMCRLATMNSPPGDFWKISRNLENMNYTKVMHTINIKDYVIHVHT